AEISTPNVSRVSGGRWAGRAAERGFGTGVGGCGPEGVGPGVGTGDRVPGGEAGRHSRREEYFGRTGPESRPQPAEASARTALRHEERRLLPAPPGAGSSMSSREPCAGKGEAFARDRKDHDGGVLGMVATRNTTNRSNGAAHDPSLAATGHR